MNTPNPYAPPKADVQDVADPNAAAEKATRGSRLGAVMLDGVIAGAIIYVPALLGGGLMGAMAKMARTGNPMDVYAAFMGIGGLISLVGLLAWIIVTYRLVKANGQTIAKKMLGIKVVRSDGSKASVARIFWLRNVVNTLFSVIPVVGAVYGLIDALFIFGESRQCVHDKLADTIVVKA